LWVSDFLNHRVLFFNCRALQNQPAASLVIGQHDFTSSTAGTGPRGFSGPAGLALSFDDRWLVAADMLNHRVLAFDLEQADDFLAAAAVVGQDDFSGCEPGTSAQKLRAPSGVAIDANNQLYVADTGNNRVVVFDGHAELTGASAYVVLGQPDFNSAIPAAGAEGLNAPVAVGLDDVDGWFFVADTGNNRVVVYDANASNLPTAHGIIGQPDTESSAPQPAARGLDMPLGLLFDIIEQRLWVSEGGSARVGVYNLGSQ
jgi:sugar lactone lactonase YvrE